MFDVMILFFDSKYCS